MDLDLDSVAEDLLLPPAPPVRALGKFQPKAHPKTVKSGKAPSKPPIAPPSTEPPIHVSDPESAWENSSLQITSDSEERMARERIFMESDLVSDSAASLCVRSDKIEAEGMASCLGLESEQDTAGSMNLDLDSVTEDLLLPPAPPVRALGKFRPKAHPKTVKSGKAPSKPPIAPLSTEPPIHVSDPESARENSSLRITSDSEERMAQEGHFMESDLISDSAASLCIRSDRIEAEGMSEERMAQEGHFMESDLVSDSAASLCIRSDRIEAEGMASCLGLEFEQDTAGSMNLDLDSVAEDLLLPPAPPVRALGKFRPKAHPKIVKSGKAPSKPPIVPLSKERPIHVSDPESAWENSSLRITSDSEERMTEEGHFMESDLVPDSAASLCIRSDKKEAEFVQGMASCLGLESEQDTAGVMDLDAESAPDDFFLPPAPAVRTLSKFQPKAHPKDINTVQASLKSLVVMQLVPPIAEPPICDSSLESQDEKLSLPVASIDCSLINTSDLDTTHSSVCHHEAFPSDPFVPGGNNENSLQCDQGEGEGSMDLDTDSSSEDLLLPPTPAVRALGKFQPKAHFKTVKSIQAPPKLHGASQLVPSIQGPPVCVSDPKSPDKKSNLPIASIDNSLINASNLNTAHGSVCQQENFPLETSDTGGNNEVTLQLDQGEREVAYMLSMECVDLNQPLPTLGRVVGRFEPKAELESKDDKLSPTYVSDPGVIMSHSTQGHCISSFAVEVLPPERQLSKEPFCHNEERVTQEGISPERAQLSDSDANSHIHPAKLEVDVVASSTCLESVDDGLFQSHATSGAMDLDVDSVAEDILLQPSPSSVRPLGKFRPKAHPKSNKSVQTPSKPSVTTQVTAITEHPVLVPNPTSPDERSSLPNASINDCHSTQGFVCQPVAFPSEPFVSGVNNEETSQRDQGAPEEAMDLDVDTVAEDFLQSAPAVKEAGRFRPKLVPRPKEKKVKRVSFNISDTVETVHPLDNHVSLSQREGTEEIACSTTEVEPSFLEMLCEGSLDGTPDSAFVVSDCGGDVGMGRMDLREEDTTEIAGLESLEKIPSQSTTKIGKFEPKLSSRVISVKTNAPVITHDVLASIHFEKHSPPLESESFEGHTPIVSPNSQFDSVTTGDSMPADLILEQTNHVDTCASSEYNHVVGRETSPELSKDIRKEDRFHDDADVTDQILNEKSTSKVVEGGASKSSKKLRKRVKKCTLDDEVRWDRNFDNSNINEVEEARNGDEYRGEDVPKPKRGRKKMTKPVTENEKPTRKRKKASEEPKSAEQEPKKKFPHSTSRNRRQVNKELLLMPDDEIDRRRLSIKDLIRTYEAKERISSKESAAQAISSSNQSHKSFPYDTHHGTDNGWDSDDDAENDNVQLNGTTVKWNHHSFRKKPSATSRWSKSETELFYQALRQFGTNFEMIQKLFPGRTRHQMTLKFKNERRKFPLQVADATSHPSTDFSLVKLVMEKLAEEEKEKAKEKVFYVQEEGENEDENGQTEKEEQEGDDWEGGFDSSVKPDDYEGVAYSPNQLNEYEDNLEWDGEKNEYDNFF